MCRRFLVRCQVADMELTCMVPDDRHIEIRVTMAAEDISMRQVEEIITIQDIMIEALIAKTCKVCIKIKTEIKRCHRKT